jgi:UDP-N-acetylglucosamine 2-epimerase (non-hydrolysing)
VGEAVRTTKPRETMRRAPRRRVLFVFGTRPEAIKLAPLIARLRRHRAFCCRVCVTGQHRELLRPVLRLFGIAPEHELNVMRRGQTLGGLTSRILHGVDGVLNTVAPDTVIVQGDTTTTLGAALAAFYRGIPVAHVEAGLRTGRMDSPFPEEANRRVTGALATWHFAATPAARANLLREGVPERSIVVTGNTVVDALRGLEARIAIDPQVRERMRRRFPWLRELKDGAKRLLLVTAHRRESFGAGIDGICSALRQVAERRDVRVVWPLHLNPDAHGPVQRILGVCPGVSLVPALDYLSFVYLLLRSFVVLTDSGGVQEEAPSLGKPVLVLRAVTERREAVDAGVARVVGTCATTIVHEVERLLSDDGSYEAMTGARDLFGDGQASARIERALVRWLQ